MPDVINYWPLLGVGVVVAGFALRRNPVLVVVIAGIVSALAAGMSVADLLALLGRIFVENRMLLLFLLILPVIGLLEHYGLRERARSWIAGFRGLTLTRFQVTYLGLRQLLSMAGLTYQDIDLFVPHQANLRIIQTAMKHMNIPAEKTVINLDKFGNTSAASIPVALSMAEEEGRLKSDDLVLIIAFGAGLTYGGALIRWGSE